MSLSSLSNWLVFSLLRLPENRLGEAISFFLYDSIKILILLTVIIYAVTFLRTFLPPERIKAMLTHKNRLVGHVLAAGVGIVTPFCSCSAIPLFLGIIESGVPAGIAFSYLVSAPMVNEVAMVLLLALFGWKAMTLYIGSGVLLAILTGLVLGRMHIEHLIDRGAATQSVAKANPTVRERFARSWRYTRNLVRRIFPYVLLGVAAGAFIHGYAPEDFLARVAGKSNPFAVPIAVLIGVPLYSNAAGTIPIVSSLLEKGLPMGTALAFMMAVTALSVPEMIILRRILKPKLLALYVGILTVGIMLTGYLFNAVL
ncbi:MAG: permease [Candidatus Peribacteraceae bacterium]